MAIEVEQEQHIQEAGRRRQLAGVGGRQEQERVMEGESNDLNTVYPYMKYVQNFSKKEDKIQQSTLYPLEEQFSILGSEMQSSDINKQSSQRVNSQYATRKINK